MNILDVLYEAELFEEDYEDYEIIEEEFLEEQGKPGPQKRRETRRVVRQFKRYGNTFKRHFRCMSGPRKGRLVANPANCGKRKDPRRVRIGKKSARIRKGGRVRRTRLTKRKTPHKILARWNKRLRGEK